MSKHSAHGAAWKAQRLRVLHRDEWRCTYCGVQLQPGRNKPDSATVDHIEPIVLDPGRAYADSDLVAACARCNSTKQDRIAARIDYANRAWLPNGLPR